MSRNELGKEREKCFRQKKQHIQMHQGRKNGSLFQEQTEIKSGWRKSRDLEVA